MRSAREGGRSWMCVVLHPAARLSSLPRCLTDFHLAPPLFGSCPLPPFHQALPVLPPPSESLSPYAVSSQDRFPAN